MTEINICATCKNHCCRFPMMMQEEIQDMADGLGVPITDIPVIPSTVKHLDFLGIKFFEMNNPKECFAFESEKGCKLPHDKKPVICRLYPWIPHNFEGGDWELLLDVVQCPHWKVWGKDYKAAMKEFDEIRAKNPERWSTK